jgi:hypothetical protein
VYENLNFYQTPNPKEYPLAPDVEIEARRAEREAKRAEMESRRAQAMAEKLRSLGIDPDQL